MLQFFNLYTSAELICFISALVCLFNAKEFHWRMLVLFMLLTCMVELGAIPLKAAYRANPIPMNSNAWIYNVLLFFQIPAFAAMFYNLIGRYINSKPVVFAGTGALLLLYIVEAFTNADGIFDYNSTTYTVMSVLFILYSLYYYYLLINSEEYADLKTLPDFWWTTGTLFFFFGTTALNMFRSKLLAEPLKNTVYLSYIHDTLIVILYGCWTYAFICKRWITSSKR
nr:hypothetical protein [uncultured Mucilaginibacter sp.]